MVVLTEEQAMLKDMAAGWARERMPVGALRSLYDHSGGGRQEEGPGHDPERFAEMAGMGWTGIVVPEAYGGLEFGYAGLGLVLEELGRTLAPSPLHSSALVATSALALGGTEAQKQRLLPALANGSLIGTLALEETARHAPLQLAMAAQRTAGGWRLDGIKRPVPDGMAAGLFIVPARTSGALGDAAGITLFLVSRDAAGLVCEPLDQIDARRPAALIFTGVMVDETSVLGDVDCGAPLLEAVLDRARAGLAAELLGLAEQAFETTTDYLKTRVQFDRVIGSFQALQHRAAEMFAELQLTRSAVEAALAAIDGNLPELPELASIAKALASDTAKLIANQMIQLHGGIGMTHEHDAGLYVKRALVAGHYYGNAAFHRERWGRLQGY